MVTDAIGCTQVKSHFVTQGVTLNFNYTPTNATCLQTNGAVTSFVTGGIAPYSYLWSNAATTANISGLQGGQQYIAQITDAAGCTGTGYAYVGVTTPISVTYTASPSSCTQATGSATLTAAGGASPYSIVWYSFPSNTSGNSISGKASGTYQFKVTDANGCIQTGSAYIPPASTITANIAGSGVVCPATSGAITTNVSGSNPPFTYLWNNTATSANLTGVPLGAYSCTITDAVGCSLVKHATLSQSSPLLVGFNVTQASCIYNADGSITANTTGGTSPYTYVWSNAQSGATASNLLTGFYNVSVTDANGCHNSSGNSQVFVGYNAGNNSCYCTITGTIYADANNNCTRNTGENGIPNIQVHCSGLGYAYTNANGVYSFMAPTGNYTLTESVQLIHPLSNCQANNLTVSVNASANCSTTVNFANNTIPIHDLHLITTSYSPPIPGNNYYQTLIVQNEGTITESAIKLGYTHDGQLTYASCAPWALTQPNSTYPNWSSITSGFPSLTPGTSSSANLTYNVPTNIPINTVVNFNDTVAHAAPIATTWLTDNTPWNNVNSYQTTVVGSYDPNFKEVSPKGTGAQGNISKTDSILTYVVHFQNTGSYFAQNIVVVDTLDTDLRMSTLRPGYGDHPYSVTMSENGVIKFNFTNINLPWKDAYGDVLSSGMFSYSVKVKKNPAVGTKITNRAAIYFDYNEPIITNTTLNTIANIVSLAEFSADADNSILFPNPASNYFTLKLLSAENTTGTLNIYDVSGRELSVKEIVLIKGENEIHEVTERLQGGIYFVNLKTDNRLIQKKLVITK